MTEERRKKRVYISGQITGLDEGRIQAFFEEGYKMLRICKICGKEFNAITSKKYCSKECVSQVNLKRALERYYKNHPKRYKRFSGKWYRNSPEKLQAIKEKYRNGVSKTQIEDRINSL